MIEYIAVPVGADACRLLHGRGHCWAGYEHVSLDWYSPLLLITLFAEETEERLQHWAALLQAAIPAAEAVVVQYRCRPGAPFRVLAGEMTESMVIEEHGLKYWLQLGQQQNTGLFLDMANGRRYVQDHADGKRVLNLFAYTCGFSVAAVAGGATSVFNVDMSHRALSCGRDNHRLNGHELGRVEFAGLDIFRSFGRIRRRGPYDLVICDPPTFQRGSVDIRKDYPRLLKRLPEWLVPGGEALLCLNAPDLEASYLIELVAEHCPDCVFIERIANPEVFVEANPEAGLKVLRFIYQP